MTKQSFLVVSLKDGKAKKLAQVLTNDTSLKILDYLTNKDATETELANGLDIPISTIHYNLKILVDSKMIKSDEFHYSDKGKMVNHYTLANKYILISPEREAGLKERLKTFFPVSVILLAAAGAVQIISAPQFQLRYLAKQAQPEVFAVGRDAAEGTFMSIPSAASQNTPPNIALWFLIGSFATLGLYLLFMWLRERE
jgi:DNA-binding transcriptional ArsR family regulator